MKKIILFASILTAGLCLSSCEDFLTEENPNAIPVTSYFATENDVERAVNGAYLALRSDYCMGEGSTAYTEERSDNTGRLDNQSASGEPFQFTNFALLPSNTYLKSHWDAMFQAVTNSNFALLGAETVSFDDEEDQKNYMAEARFVRALAYFDIVRKWGDAPLVDTYLSTPAEITAHTYREDKAKVYQLIVDDLKYGLEESTLPDLTSEGEKGHACKAAMSGLLGKVYLTMAHVLEDGNSNTYLNNALTYLLQCYNMRTFTNLSEITYDDDASTGLYAVANKSTCPEIIFQIVYIQGDKDYYSSVAVDNQSKGISINSQYVSTGMGTYVNPDLVKEYEDGDARKDYSVTYAPSYSSWNITKFRDTSDAAGTLGYGGNDWIILRYADVILMLAEAYNELGQTSQAISYLNQVRERAGLADYNTSLQNADYAALCPTLKRAILHERRVELAFENQRWYDLLRFFTTDELITYMHSKDGDDYGISNLQNFSSKDIYYPIPYDEWKLNNEGMYQNPGY
ncbi:MAG: RagB/SusD family nutrient uptake outer membrane protein [Bacteroides sp.]|nr:RagB/SusD family nutrient uptake outer membrane protein [Bacteroides sp.]